MPRWAQSIRFRLSLAYALAVFAAGSVLIGALYSWQVRQLNEPIMVDSSQVVFENEAGQQFETQFRALTRDELNNAVLQQFERAAYARSLSLLRQASLALLPVLFVVAFGSGWLLAGWTLQPMGRMVAVARDISATELSRRIGLTGPDDELKDLADTFDEMLDRLQASFEDQRRFVQDASHELRNPLAVTQANLELVIDDDQAGVDELRTAATIAHASTDRLARIVDDLVTAAREGMPLRRSDEVDLGLLATTVADETLAAAHTRAVSIEVRSAGGGPDTGARAETDGSNGQGTLSDDGGGVASLSRMVKGDEAALHRAVANLLLNAVRLAPEHSTVTITTGVKGDSAFVAVADQGPGIPIENRELVFERFWRGEANGKGLGLGLSIVKQVAERHGGRVEVVSEVGVGSTFTLLVPIPVVPGYEL